VNASNTAFLRGLVERVLTSRVAATGRYVFNLSGRWRYETRAQRCERKADLRREWSGEVLAYAWLSRQAKECAQRAESPPKPGPAAPDVQILALTRS
jgi:hypothetical protein